MRYFSIWNQTTSRWRLMTDLMNESSVIHSNGWFIQKRGKWLLSLCYWIIDSLDSFNNVDSFSIETPLCCSERRRQKNSSVVALIETLSANLSKNSQYCITNHKLICFTLCSSRGALMSYSDRSVRCCFKSKPTPHPLFGSRQFT